MNVHIAAKEFDLSGYIEVRPLLNAAPGSAARRVSRAATLDGSSAFIDRGFTHSDRQMQIQYRPVSQEHDERARRILELHERVTISTREGCFEAVPESFDGSPTRNTFTLWIVSKLSEG
jgi:hypothetical protein